MKLQSIQLLRAVAILLVVFFSIRTQELFLIQENHSQETPLTSGFALNGYAGVDLFFVISGFIMVYITRKLPTGTKTAKDFIIGRMLRVYPVWWAYATIAVILLLLPIGLSDDAGLSRAAQGEPTLLYLFKSYFLLPQDAFPLPSVGWILIHQVYFYIIFALIILTPRNWWIALLFGWGCLVAFGGMLGLSTAHASNLPELVFFPMTMEFIIGAAVGVAVQSGFSRHAGIVMLAAVLWFVFALAAHGDPTYAALSWGRVIWFGLPSALLVYAIVTLELHQRLVWLVPASIGFITGMFFFYLYGFQGGESAGLRYGAGILSAAVSLIAMLVTLWGGYLFAQSSPERFMAQGPRLKNWMSKLSDVGDQSFTLYLSHILTLIILQQLFRRLGDVEFLKSLFQVGHNGPLDNIFFVLICFAACVLIAKLAYRFIEQPLARYAGKVRTRLSASHEPKSTPPR